jgi:hypothetical protein
VGLSRKASDLFKNLVVSAEGTPYFQVGAADYRTYLRRAEQMSEDVVDSGLPQLEDEEIKYEGEGQRGFWVALNSSDDDGERTQNTRLEGHTVTNWSVASWTFTVSYLRHKDKGRPGWDPRDYEKLSYSICHVLRHVGCTSGQSLGCDSGGWYRLDSIIGILLRQLSEAARERGEAMLEWVEELHQKFAHRGLLRGMDYQAWMIAILKAIVPRQHEPPRYQMATEKMPG